MVGTYSNGRVAYSHVYIPLTILSQVVHHTIALLRSSENSLRSGGYISGGTGGRGAGGWGRGVERGWREGALSGWRKIRWRVPERTQIFVVGYN